MEALGQGLIHINRCILDYLWYFLPVLVEHNGKISHGSKGLVSEGEVKENGLPTSSPVSRDLQTFPLDSVQEHLMERMWGRGGPINNTLVSVRIQKVKGHRI